LLGLRRAGAKEVAVGARSRAGVTLVELVLVVIMIGLLTLVAVPNLTTWSEDQRVRGAARSVADAFQVARGEAIRTGNPHLVVFQGALGATQPIEVANDGDPAAADCNVGAGEVVHSVAPVPGVVWGTTDAAQGGAGGTAAPGDPGLAASSIATGSSFTDATRSPANGATWVLFQADGLPRLFTPGAGDCDAIGQVGQGGGAIYLSNGRRDLAVVLGPLGTTRLHLWNGGAWQP
jgi:type II secretory pathway pseudopilin PulG